MEINLLAWAASGTALLLLFVVTRRYLRPSSPEWRNVIRARAFRHLNEATTTESALTDRDRLRNLERAAAAFDEADEPGWRAASLFHIATLRAKPESPDRDFFAAMNVARTAAELADAAEQYRLSAEAHRLAGDIAACVLRPINALVAADQWLSASRAYRLAGDTTCADMMDQRIAAEFGDTLASTARPIGTAMQSSSTKRCVS